MQWVPGMMTILAALALGTTADCPRSISIQQIVAGLGASVRAQPVYTGGTLKGWRVYGTSESPLLTSHGVAQGSLLTHVCSVPAREIFENNGQVCCAGPASGEVEVTFQVKDQETNVPVTPREVSASP